MGKRLVLEGLTIKAVLVLGLGLTLAVWLFTGYYFARRMSAVEEQSAAISARYMRAQELLAAVSSRVLVSSVYLRDALLDSNPVEISNHQRRLEETYDELDRVLDEYVPVLDAAEEREHVAHLRREIDAFRATSRELLGVETSRTTAEARAVLNTRVVPKREAVIRMAEDVRALNRAAFVRQQTVIATLHRVAERRSWGWLGMALAISLVIGLIATAYSSRLENSLRWQRAVEAQNARYLQQLSTKLITAQEEERQSLARELHDEVGQVLTAIKVELDVAQRRFSACGAPSELLDDAQMIAATALHTVRDLSHSLHPALLDDLGLLAAIDWFLQGFAKRHGIRADLQQDGMTKRLAPEVELAAYRIVQEALTNIARHAQARSCRVTLRRVLDRIEIVIQDDGSGFDVSALPEPGARRGLGLLGMRERAAQLTGTVRIQSTVGEGTRVKVTLPARPAPDVDIGEEGLAHG